MFEPEPMPRLGLAARFVRHLGRMLYRLVFDPRAKWLVTTALFVVLAVLSACQNSGNSGGGVPGY